MLAAADAILVTGATDGLGRAVAGELAAGGATVLVHGRSAERGEATVAELR
jgi:NAD(P)-dependent dehydrogenase (short-subunit alcohol dehydrogenase family)